jgi:hypothetical protein
MDPRLAFLLRSLSLCRVLGKGVEVFGMELRLRQQAVHLLLLGSLFLLHPATATFLRQMHKPPFRAAVHEVYSVTHSWVVWAGWVVQADASAPPDGRLPQHQPAERCEPLVLLLAIHLLCSCALLYAYWAYDQHNRRRFLAGGGAAAVAAAAASSANSGRGGGKPGGVVDSAVQNQMAPAGSKTHRAPSCPSLVQQAVTHAAAAAGLVALSFGVAHLVALGLLPAVLPAAKFAQLCPAD